jgi:hypothetical protein
LLGGVFGDLGFGGLADSNFSTRGDSELAAGDDEFAGI